MKIMHICLVGAGFNEGWSYQENMLTKYNSLAGHDVSIITSQWIRNPNGGIIKLDKTKYVDINSCKIYRLPIKNRFKPSNRFRRYLGIEEVLNEENPDVIYVHNFQFLDITKIADYIQKNPNVRLYVDSHTDRNNSAQNWISLNILHKFFYKKIIKSIIKYVDKVFYISYEGKDFLKEVYGIPESLLEFYPLGGVVVNEKEKGKHRLGKRRNLGVSQEDIVFCHSGKMDNKKRTYEILENFSKVKDKRFRLIIIGSFTSEVEKRVMPLIQKDNRVIYLGWKSSEELIQYIAASDLYLQPGSQSATMQNALCAGTPVLFENVKSHQPYINGNAFVIDNYDEMKDIFIRISNNPEILKQMSKKAYIIAREILDYEKLADRIK